MEKNKLKIRKLGLSNSRLKKKEKKKRRKKGIKEEGGSREGLHTLGQGKKYRLLRLLGACCSVP